MAVFLNHTIIFAEDKHESASFFTRLFDLPEAVLTGAFLAVELDNGVTLDFAEPHIEIQSQHYAFLVTEEEFDGIYGLIVEGGLEHWADPHKSAPGSINTNDGGRGVYFNDPSGHLFEAITRPYGSGK